METNNNTLHANPHEILGIEDKEDKMCGNNHNAEDTKVDEMNKVINQCNDNVLADCTE